MHGLTGARIVGVSWWRRMFSRIRDRLHLWSGCECIVINTDEGIGGQCITCGRVYGWMTSGELRRVPAPSIDGAYE